MANNIFKPYKVLSSKLSSLPIKAGQFIITTDTNLIYVDIDNSTRKCYTPTKLSELTNDAGFLENFTESDPTVPTHVKNIKSTDITNWNNKSNFSGSYNDLTNKPDITSLETKTDASAKLTEAKNYTDTKIGDLIGTAPETLDTIYEVAEAIKENEDVIDALNESIGKKANTSDLSKVATSGSYNDLSNKPTIPTVENSLSSTSTTNALSSAKGKELQEQINGVLQVLGENTDYIISAIPTDNSQLENGAGYQTASDVNNIVSTKQDKLVSGTNIKTINGTTILGGGNIDIDSGISEITSNTNIYDLDTGFYYVNQGVTLTCGTSSIDETTTTLTTETKSILQVVAMKNADYGIYEIYYTLTTVNFENESYCLIGTYYGHILGVYFDAVYWFSDAPFYLTLEDIQAITKRTTSISNSSSDEEIPTAKAVYDYIASLNFQTQINSKQATLVSGTNIKTINGQSLLGAGNINTENTTYTFATGDSNGQIKVTPSGGSAQNISVKGLGSLAYKSSLSASDVGALASSLKGAASGVAELDANGKVPTAQLPSYVDDTIEGYLYNSKFYKESAHTTVITGETGKIYVDLSTNKTYRWSGSAFIEISASLALGTTSSTAFRGDYGNTAYTHATAKGSAFASGLYKITTNAQGHVTAATAVAKSDINNLGVPSIYVSSSEPSNMAAGDVWFVTE